MSYRSCNSTEKVPSRDRTREAGAILLTQQDLWINWKWIRAEESLLHKARCLSYLCTPSFYCPQNVLNI